MVVGITLAVLASLAAQGAAGGKPHHRARPRLTNLSISIDGPAFVPVGGQSAFQLTVRNAGPNRATGAAVYLTLPEGPLMFVPAATPGCNGGSRWAICKVGVVRPRQVRTVHVTLAAAAPELVKPQVVVLAKQIDLNINDNIATTVVALQPSPALADVSVHARPYPGIPPTTDPGGEPYSQVTLVNRGPGQALRVEVEYRLPEGGRFKAVEFPPVGCDNGLAPPPPPGPGVPTGHPFVLVPGAPVGFCVPRLMPGESRAFTASVALPPGTTWSAAAHAATPDPDPKNNIVVADASDRACDRCPQP